MFTYQHGVVSQKILIFVSAAHCKKVEPNPGVMRCAWTWLAFVWLSTAVTIFSMFFILQWKSGIFFILSHLGAHYFLPYLFQIPYMFEQLCVQHQENLLYLCDTGIFHPLWVVFWSHPNQQTRQPPIQIEKGTFLQRIQYNSLYIWSSPFTSCPHSWRALLSTTVAAP